MKIISECPIVAKGQLLIELLFSEFGIVDGIADKEA